MTHQMLDNTGKQITVDQIYRVPNNAKTILNSLNHFPPNLYCDSLASSPLTKLCLPVLARHILFAVMSDPDALNILRRDIREIEELGTKARAFVRYNRTLFAIIAVDRFYWQPAGAEAEWRQTAPYQGV